MAKSPDKQNKNMTEIQVKVLQEWLFVLKILDDIMINIRDATFNEIRNKIIYRGIAAINTDNRLASHDESIYVYYTHLMSYYARTVDMYNDNKSNIKSEKIKSILDGLHSVITSRLKLFEEIYEQYGDNEDDLDINPISIEKKQLIQRSIKSYNKNFNALCSRFAKQHAETLLLLVRGNIYMDMDYTDGLNVVEKVTDVIWKESSENLYKIYGTFTKNTLHSLNNIQLREVTSYYHDILKEEQEIMSSIIKIQIGALENEIESNNSVLEEKTILFNMLSNLREGHQYLGKQISEIMECFVVEEGSKENMMIESLEQFREFLKKSTNINELLSEEYFSTSKIRYKREIEEFRQSFTELVNIYIDKDIKEYNVNQHVYSVRKSISENIFITDDMIDVFGKVLKDTNIDSIENLDEDSKAIIDGIHESMLIKIDTLKEAKEEFVENVNSLLKRLESEEVKFTEDDRASVMQESFEMWNKEMINCPKENDQAIIRVEKVLGNIRNCEKLYIFREKFGKKQMSNIESINKKILSYKREYLLFEISTFEEIMNYSVEKLRHNELLKSYVEFMDNIVVELASILKKNNIDIIKPNPHDMFNGKEHEVLLAEKKEDFAKGEIIKLMNCGYKQNDVVLLRANVIAAK